MAHIIINTAVIEPQGPDTPLSAPVIWERFAHYPNHLAAHIVAGLLENEGVPAIVESGGIPLCAADYACLWVPKSLSHRARWILALQAPTDDELTFLATHELPSSS